MLYYFIQRILGAIPVVFAGITITFFILHLAPGDPASLLLSPSSNAATEQILTERYGLDQSLFSQYLKWLSNVIFHFDFGNSFRNGRPAGAIITEAFSSTILLTLSSLIIGLIIGIAVGVFAALRNGTASDRLLNSLMLIFYSTPTFWIGLILLIIFGIQLDWFPISQLTSVWHDHLSLPAKFFDYIAHLTLPVITLCLPISATFYRYIRSGMIEALQSEYVLAAKARGISHKKIIWNYALRNAILPVISILGLSIPMLFSGAVVIEVIFSLPGMGRTLVSATLSRDYPVILAAGVFSFIAVIVGNLFADIGYGLADPRIRIKGTN